MLHASQFPFGRASRYFDAHRAENTSAAASTRGGTQFHGIVAFAFDSGGFTSLMAPRNAQITVTISRTMMAGVLAIPPQSIRKYTQDESPSARISPMDTAKIQRNIYGPL